LFNLEDKDYTALGDRMTDDADDDDVVKRYGALSYCSNLSKVTLPYIAVIAYGAFMWCDQLEEAVLPVQPASESVCSSTAQS
jgi:hypothetical protein